MIVGVADDLEPFLNRTPGDTMRRSESGDGAGAAYRLFRRAAREAPAYAAFLQANGIRSEMVGSVGDFARLPLMTKRDYMQVYPLPERCWGGRLAGCDRVAVSSGSTGIPTFWPRSQLQEAAVAARFEQVFRDSFQAHDRDTLAVVCFALGNWVGGIYTTSCLWSLAQQGYPLTVATPGNNKAEIFRIVRELAPHYQQTVLLGYPPFVKDVIDAGAAEGIDWPRFRTGMVFAGEVFSEEWRTLLSERVGAVDRICYASASLYGTADGGVLGNETPLSIAIRRFLASHPDAARQLFGESRLPTLVQYDPLSRYFETHEGTLVVTADSGVPLIRYHIADQGGLVSYGAMRDFLDDCGVRSLADYGLDETQDTRELPFVFVFGRADFTISYYGANIYPENVTVGLEQQDLMPSLTGKFVLEAPETLSGDKILRLTVELAQGQEATDDLADRIAGSVRCELLRLNSEFANYTPSEKQRPEVVLRPFADPEYFAVGVKHRYTRR